MNNPIATFMYNNRWRSLYNFASQIVAQTSYKDVLPFANFLISLMCVMSQPPCKPLPNTD